MEYEVNILDEQLDYAGFTFHTGIAKFIDGYGPPTYSFGLNVVMEPCGLGNCFPYSCL